MGICAGNKADLVGERERGEGRPLWTNWSLDHQLEFCECSAVADTFTGSRDTEGVERVVEALGSHAWSGFAKKLPGPSLDAPITSGATAPAAQEQPAADALPAQRAFDTSKWDRYVTEQPHAEAEAEAQAEMGKLRLEKTCYDGELPVDEDVVRLVESAQLRDDEVCMLRVAQCVACACVACVCVRAYMCVRVRGWWCALGYTTWYHMPFGAVP